MQARRSIGPSSQLPLQLFLISSFVQLCSVHTESSLFTEPDLSQLSQPTAIAARIGAAESRDCIFMAQASCGNRKTFCFFPLPAQVDFSMQLLSLEIYCATRALIVTILHLEPRHWHWNEHQISSKWLGTAVSKWLAVAPRPTITTAFKLASCPTRCQHFHRAIHVKARRFIGPYLQLSGARRVIFDRPNFPINVRHDVTPATRTTRPQPRQLPVGIPTNGPA